ncbi:Uncharacterized protein OS=Singulisphaera acidiphila (strain ATCC BAA-1392 / DSM 18658 / VKM B-2454 / MOB10) GN=Sinac_7637 PE=4 SV=1 [Gemmataceae bacterium]|nr:Uncharacterized protein OS=Singulisphaera acidiphila (strain ATCC BAA-1392 / DSM 18658 / VKM B-2454 / MOB10) GN=Sinac_7637 PE=4 SV=1 [Gemmataceae bacterium]VTU01336.1 Uncharacterized protein OS=Singulisphaera acidiphila (strain ATCC BAA-1392 / DSM 18658 / VKM B-2454 / MOB10) GN=Sinac_7637 PE=4 SV=1 [Gemmataceae bacterium]
MGWEQRGAQRYYYAAERIDGRVVKRYVGAGALIVEFAALQAETRAEKTDEAARIRCQRDELTALGESLTALDDLADTLAAAALVAAGFHRHHRGPWRKRRA